MKKHLDHSGHQSNYSDSKTRDVGPIIRGKEARTRAGFAENISRERELGKSMKRAVGTAYGEADLARDKAKRDKRRK